MPDDGIAVEFKTRYIRYNFPYLFGSSCSLATVLEEGKDVVFKWDLRLLCWRISYPKEADCLCRDIGEQHLYRILITLVGLHTESENRFCQWLITDVRDFISSGLDLGTAYAVARTAWHNFNIPHCFSALTTGGSDYGGG